MAEEEAPPQDVVLTPQQDLKLLSKSYQHRQLSLLMVARLVEPLSLTILFAFVNPMVEHLMPDLPKAEVGKYSGFLESVFSLTSFMLAYQWGRWSDRIGRKPIILCGLVGISFTLCLLGLSQSYWVAMVARILSGGLCGNAAVLRASLGEMTTPENESWIYPMWSVGWDLSVILGPLLGAALSFPPNASGPPRSGLGSWPFFQSFPFFLPCFVVAFYATVCFILFLFFFEETLPAKVEQKQAPVVDEGEMAGERTGLLQGPDSDGAKTYGSGGAGQVTEVREEEKEERAMSAMELLRIPAVVHVLTSSFMLGFTAIAFDAVFVLFAYSAVPLGGMGLTPSGIAACLTLRGSLSIPFALFIFPIAQRRLGTTFIYRSFAACWIGAYILPIIINAILQNDSEGWWVKDGSLRGMWMIVAPQMLLYTFGDLSFPLNMLALNIASPNKSCLGSLNGMSLSISALSRAVGPASGGWLYSVSAERGFPYIWIVFSGIALITAAQTWRVKTTRDAVKGDEVSTEEA